MKKPFISIITPSFNRAQFIAKAIESVLAQDYEDIEHIIIDGASIDGTLAILASHSHLRVMSEPDRGVYNALNKGLGIAKGRIIGFLNSDDIYQANIFGDVVKTFVDNPEIDAIVGQSAYFEKDYFVYTPYPEINQETLPDQLLSGVSAINGWFFRREVFERIGGFDETFAIGADRDFLIKLYYEGLNAIFFNKIFYYYRMHSGSLTINNGLVARERVYLENRRLAQKYSRVFKQDHEIAHRCRVWHDSISIELMILFTRQKRYKETTKVIGAAIKQNPIWPLIVIAQSPSRILNYLKKKYGSSR